MSAPALQLKPFAGYEFKPAVGSPAPTSRKAMDEAVARLREGAERFLELSLDERIALARAMQGGYLAVAEASVAAGCKAKGIAPGTPLEGEEWSTGPWPVVRQLRLIRESLEAIKRTGSTPIGKLQSTPDGRVSVRVFPGNAIDAMLFKDVTVDVHLRAGVSEAQMHAERGKFYKTSEHKGRVALVLGAGNIASIGPMDLITKLFNEGRVCLLKMNPVNAYQGPFIEQAFAEPVRRNFLAVVYGGAEEGHYLCHHAGIDEIHVTGSDRTHDAIVWGPPGPERDARLARREPLLRKKITSELGNVSPVIVVPGPYSDKELRFQAADAASCVTGNASFHCNSAKMIVTPDRWPGTQAFVRGLEDVFSRTPTRSAYYPGAADRWNALVSGRSQVTHIGAGGEGRLPWTIIGELDPKSETESLFRTEPFCSIVSHVRLPAADPVEFLDQAVTFANERLWGTLSATLVVHPKSIKDSVVGAAVERAIAKLRYGTVGVNGFPGFSFVFAAPPWGAYPGSTLEDIQSGRGFVHNTSMLEDVDKAVVRFPISSFPKPGHFATHRTAHAVMRRLVSLDENASWGKVPGVVFAAMRC